MSLILHQHPLSSYCWKAILAFYENATPFEARLVDLGDPDGAAAFKVLWPMGKMPVLRDEARDRTIPESSIIIEYLQTWYPGAVRFIPDDPDLALGVRLADRFYDLYVETPIQAIVADRLRPAQARDPLGVDQAYARLAQACDLVERDMAERTWAAGEAFSLADCAAFPALFYADKLMPLAAGHPNAVRYLDRLKARPAVARVIEEAQPYFAMFPAG
jgi:glutathione S-transferase